MEALTIIGAIAALAVVGGVSVALHRYSCNTYDYPPFNIATIGFVPRRPASCSGRLPLVGNGILSEHTCSVGVRGAGLRDPADIRDRTFQFLYCNLDGYNPRDPVRTRIGATCRLVHLAIRQTVA